MEKMTPEVIRLSRQLRATAYENWQRLLVMRAEIACLEFAAGKAVSMADVRKMLNIK